MKLFLCLLNLLTGLAIAQGQPCQSGKLDPRVASALKRVLGDLKPVSQTTSLEQIRAVKMPASPFPASDVQQVKLTKDSIGLQIYNPTHRQGLPIINYHQL